MSADTDRAIADLGKWFIEHKDTIPKENIQKRIDFLETVCLNLVNAWTFVARDIQGLEQRRKSPSLYVPRGMSLRGDLTKLD